MQPTNWLNTALLGMSTARKHPFLGLTMSRTSVKPLLGSSAVSFALNNQRSFLQAKYASLITHRNLCLLTRTDDEEKEEEVHEFDVWHDSHSSGLESHRKAQLDQLEQAKRAEQGGEIRQAFEIYQDVYDRDTFINEHQGLELKIRNLRTRIEQQKG